MGGKTTISSTLINHPKHLKLNFLCALEAPYLMLAVPALGDRGCHLGGISSASDISIIAYMLFYWRWMENRRTMEVDILWSYRNLLVTI